MTTYSSKFLPAPKLPGDEPEKLGRGRLWAETRRLLEQGVPRRGYAS